MKSKQNAKPKRSHGGDQALGLRPEGVTEKDSPVIQALYKKMGKPPSKPGSKP